MGLGMPNPKAVITIAENESRGIPENQLDCRAIHGETVLLVQHKQDDYTLLRSRYLGTRRWTTRIWPRAVCRTLSLSLSLVVIPVFTGPFPHL